MKQDPRIAIVGGGIGGLTLAIALQQKSFNVTVYENAPQIKPLGAGLGLAGNAVKAFSELGIDDDVLKVSNVMKRVVIKDDKGNVLTETNSEKLSEKFGIVNNFTVHRADLQHVLLSKVQPGTVVFAKGCAGFTQTPEGVQLTFHDGTTEHADVVVACDGIHSVFRKKLVPNSTPRYAGYTCWRAVIDKLPAHFNNDETSESWGAGKRFGIVPLADNRVYWYATVNAKANDTRFKTFSANDLLKTFHEFHAPVQEILNNTSNDQLIWSDIIDLQPLKKYAFGNIVLMGDAAHATTPNMGQGACMAIEDAVILANCMEDYATLEEAFVQFERKRLPRTTRIVNDSWRIGKVAQWRNPVLTSLRNAALRATPERFAEEQVKFIQGVTFY